jgi:hypothetical protein
MSNHANAQAWILLEQFLAECRKHQCFAATCWDYHKGISTLLAPIGMEGIQGGALVWSKG